MKREDSTLPFSSALVVFVLKRSSGLVFGHANHFSTKRLLSGTIGYEVERGIERYKRMRSISIFSESVSIPFPSCF